VLITSEDRRRYLRDVLDELDRSLEEIEKEIEDAVREGLASGRKLFSKPFVAGVAMKVGPEGKPTVQFFGDAPLSSEGYRAPIHEQVLDEKSKVLRVIIELPGVEKNDILVSAADDRISVKAEKETRKYKADLALKKEIDPESGGAEYKNGILEISFSLKDKTNKGYRRVSVV